MATAAPAAVGMEVVNGATGLYLDDSDQFGLRAYPGNGGVYQKWYVTEWADNTRELRNQATGRCLDDSLESGLRTYPCNKSRYQSWYFYANDYSPGYVSLKNQQTGLVLDDSSAGLRCIAYYGNSYQAWDI